MEAYNLDVERLMRRLFESLNEKDRRRYAAVEALKLGHGGVEYVAVVMGCDPKTVAQGHAELAELPEDRAGGRIRKKGVVAEPLSRPRPVPPELWTVMSAMAAGAGLKSIRLPRSS